MKRFVTRLFLAVFALPDAPAGADETFSLQPVRVEDEREDEPDAAAEAPSFSSVLPVYGERESLTTTAELLSGEAGVQVKSIGGLEAFTSVSVRASTSQQVGVFIDGIPVNRALLGSFDFSEVPAGSVERIEVYRGFVPPELAGANLAGAVNIVTREAENEKGLGCAASFGSFGSRRLDLSHSGKYEKYGWIVTANYLGGDGDFSFANDNGTPENPSDDRFEDRRNNSFDSGGMLGKLRYSISKDASLTLSNEAFWRAQGLPGIDYAQAVEARLATAWDMPVLAVSAKNLGSGLADAEARLSASWRRTGFHDPDGEIGITRSETIDVEKSAGGGLSVSLYPASWNTVSLTAAGMIETFRYKSFMPSEEVHDTQKRASLTTSARDDLYLFRERLLLAPAVTAQLISGGGKDIMLVSPQLGSVIGLASFARLKADAGLSARAPTFAELYGHEGAIVGNGRLRPEKAFNADAGIDLRAKRWGALRRPFAVASLFYRRSQDLIRFVQNSQNTFKAKNIDSAEVKGIETSVGSRVGGHFEASVNYTHQIAVNLSPAVYLHGKMLPYVAGDELSARCQVSFRKWKLFYAYDLTGENYLTESNLPVAAAVPSGGAPLPARHVHSAGAAFAPFEKLRLAVEVKNIGDGKYVFYDGYPLPGRSLFLTVSYNQ